MENKQNLEWTDGIDRAVNATKIGQIYSETAQDKEDWESLDDLPFFSHSGKTHLEIYKTENGQYIAQEHHLDDMEKRGAIFDSVPEVKEFFENSDMNHSNLLLEKLYEKSGFENEFEKLYAEYLDNNFEKNAPTEEIDINIPNELLSKEQAIKDFNNFNNNSLNQNEYLAFAIDKKINYSDDYKNHIIDEIKNFHQKNDLPMPLNSFVQSKIESFSKESNNLSENQKVNFNENFQTEITNINDNKNIENNLEFNKDKLFSSIHYFIKNNEFNDRKMVENTQYMLSYMKEKPNEFNAFSENFVTSGTIKNTDLPDNIRNMPMNQAKRFSSELNKSVINKFKQYIKLTDSVDDKKNMTQTLKNYRQSQFKEEYSEIKKSNEIKNKKKINNNLGMKI